MRCAWAQTCPDMLNKFFFFFPEAAGRLATICHLPMIGAIRIPSMHARWPKEEKKEKNVLRPSVRNETLWIGDAIVVQV